MKGMWSNLRADAALRELEALTRAGLDVIELHSQTLSVLKRVVPFDGACFGAVDPDTLLLTSGVTIGFEPSDAESERFVEIEYSGIDPNSFGSLVARKVPVLADGGGFAPNRRLDVRYNELGKLIGFAHETRMTFTVDGLCWAVGDLYRSDRSDDFDGRELLFLETAGQHIAAATRAATNDSSVQIGVAPVGAAVLIIDADGGINGMTDVAKQWIDALDPDHVARLGFAVRAAVAVARRGVPTAFTRLRIGGTWTVVRASSLQAGSDRASVAVTIDQASPADLTQLRMAAHGISPRERDVCLEVLAGRSTQEIADHLFIAAHTVQDHLKSIFAKTGVRSRRELVAAFGAS